MVLTPEIVGPNRFESLENYIASQDFSKKSASIWIVVFALGFVCSIPWVLVDTSRRVSSTLGVQWVSPVGRAWILLFILFSVLGLIFLGRPDAVTKLIQVILNNLSAYLRRASVFRSIAVALGVTLFFAGTVLELFLEWPF